MNFSSINIQGNIVSSEVIDKIRLEENYKYQKAEAFGLSRNASLRDEIGLAWSNLTAQWKSFNKRLEMLPEGDTGTSLTREKWILPLLLELNYQVSKKTAKEVNGKSYAISHGANNIDDFPVHIMGYHDHLDKKRESGGPRLSPHALVQEYLNNTEHLYAIVTNGKQLRILRDATRLVRLSYLEFDLVRMFEEELYADFSILYRLLHVSRMPKAMDEGPDSYIEYYHQESMASGTRIREKLSLAVEESIRTMANGFLSQHTNTLLTDKFEEKEIDAKTFYTHQLRLIYRILFVIVLEERNLIYPDKLDEEQQRKRDIYFKYYSIERLRRLTELGIFVDGNKHDLWESLKTTFILFEDKKYGQKLDIAPLGSGLFAPDAIGELKSLFLRNEDLLKVLRCLTSFESDQGQLVRVNYSDLDVEEFGSVYEGLLEYDPDVQKRTYGWEFNFIKGDDRSSSGSHYTPEELVKPLIKHSLEYIIADKKKEPNPEEALLSITVCDVACGSGHILLSAARRIATELASIREGAEQPSPTYYRAAIRDVIRNCIYGVDYNPLAVELCKVALWLEAHNPNEPLNFLDHHIKCGNAIVGLAHFEELEKGIADEAFKTLPGDEKEFAATLRKKNKEERERYIAEQKSYGQQITLGAQVDLKNSLEEIREQLIAFSAMPEHTPAEIKAKGERYNKLLNSKRWWRLKNLADLQVAQFFIPKTLDNRDRLTTEGKYRTYLKAGSQILDQGASLSMAEEKRIFHWFLEFPEVFAKGGFDCILGNPPFLGGQKLTGTFGNNFAEFIKHNYSPIGSVDLVTYFFRRIFSIIKESGFQSLISTNTIAQGDARSGGLGVILKQDGVINHAVRSMKWPGLAAVEVALVTIFKGLWKGKYILDQTQVNQITSYLDDSIPLGDPLSLKVNENKSYQGSIVLGKGFILSPEKAVELIDFNPINKDVVFPYLNGDDLNNQINQKASRWVINFHDWPLRRYSYEEWGDLESEERQLINNRISKGANIVIAPPDFSDNTALDYRDCFEIVETKVKRERLSKKGDRSAIYWWQFLRIRGELYSTISKMERVLVVAQVSKTVAFSFVPANQVLDAKLVVIALQESKYFAIYQSTIHNVWAWKYCTTMKADLSYTPTAIFQTFVICENSEGLNKIGEYYFQIRLELCNKLSLGLTKTYNQFHNKNLIPNVEDLGSKEFQKKYGKETWNLYNHLEVKNAGETTFEEAVPLIFELRKLHQEMDEAVLAAYGWHEDSDKWGLAIDLKHDFYEVDYLPENDRVRYTIHPDARKEVLKRLLLLNHERFEEEVTQGLHKKKDVLAFYEQKNQELPEGVKFSDAKTSKPRKKKSTVKASPKPKAAVRVSAGLFEDVVVPVSNKSYVEISNQDASVSRYRIMRNAKKGQFEKEHKHIDLDSALAKIMLGKSKGDSFVFGPNTYTIIKVS